MSQKNELPKVAPLDIVIHHVGGVGGYGPVKKVIEMFPERVVVFCFEANPSPKDLLVQKKYLEKGIRTVFVPKCLGDRNGKQKFYVNKHGASSSIFPPAPEVLEEHVPYDDVHTWGQNCEVDYVTEFDVVTLDELVEKGEIPGFDILSMDIQGSEMPVLRGGQKTVLESLCVITEVDFVEIYQGQELFGSQQDFLTKHGYRLADILNTQYWHPGPRAGLGFLTMGEALYLRTIKACLEKFQGETLLHKLLKLAAIAYAFRRLSFSSKLIGLALEKYGKQAETILSSEKDFKKMYDLQQYMEKNHSQYLKNNWFFYKNEWKEYFKKREVQRRIGIVRHTIKRFLK